MINEKWASETNAQRMKRRETVCLKCKYFSTALKQQLGSATCDYIFDTGHMRPCSPVDCKKMGVFTPRAKNSKQRRLKDLKYDQSNREASRPVLNRFSNNL